MIILPNGKIINNESIEMIEQLPPGIKKQVLHILYWGIFTEWLDDNKV